MADDEADQAVADEVEAEATADEAEADEATTASTGNIRSRRSLPLKHRKEFERRQIIKPTGTMSTKEVYWDGQVHRTPVSNMIGICYRFFYLRMVIEVGGAIAATVWSYWSQKPYSSGRSHVDALWGSF